MFLAPLPDKGHITHVGMDLWRPYRLAVQKVLPNAKIVVDKFHVASKANAVFDAVRRRIANADKRRGLGLKRAHKLFAKRKDDLNDEQYLIQVYEVTTPEEAWGEYLQWESTMPPEMDKAFRPVKTAFRNWKPEMGCDTTLPLFA